MAREPQTHKESQGLSIVPLACTAVLPLHRTEVKED